ncbi:MAG: hypothetical protein OXC60_07630 [Litoreibacter sp.]|nr:hypothetical protein [Litoreibacter sp.]
MLKLLTRHYRRLGLFAFGMGCFSLSVVSRLGLGLGQLDHLAFFAAAIVSSILVGLFVCRVIPGKRVMLEVAGISGLLSTLVVLYLSQIWDDMRPALAMFLCSFATHYLLLRSPLTRKFSGSLKWQARHSIDLPYPPKLVWKHCVPGAAPPSDHCTGLIESYEANPECKDTFRITFKPRKRGQAWYDITFLERDEPRFCRLYLEGEECDGTLTDGVFTIAIEVTDRGASTLIVHDERNGLSLYDLVERWFDDALSYHNEKLAEMLEERYGDGSGITKPLPQAAE